MADFAIDAAETAPEMRLWNDDGKRLYVTQAERAASLEPPLQRMFCQLLHDTGCRPTEGLETVPQRVQIEEGSIVFRSLKKRPFDNQGRKKAPKFRAVPVADRFIEKLDLVFGLRSLEKDKVNEPLWSMSRPTAYRLIKRVMDRAGIEGPQATGKGLRHGFAVSLLTGAKPLPLHLVAKALGHSSTKTTEIYLQVVGEEERALFAAARGEGLK